MSDITEDLHLINRIKAGELDLFSTLVSKYQDKVFAVLMKRTGDLALSEELTQVTFVKGYFGLSQFREEAALSTWLIRIALNLLATERRRKTPDHDIYQTPQADPSNPQTAHEQKQIVRRFRTCLDKLDMKYQSVLTLCALDSYTYEEAAQSLTVPIGTIRSRMNKARLLLKDCMGEFLSKEAV